MNTWKVILATLVIFGAGVITGGLLVTYTDNVQRHQRRQLTADVPRMAQKLNTNNAARNIRVPLPANVLLRTNFLERLDRELKLTAEQRERIEKIISEGQERIKAVTQKYEPQVRDELAETRERIRAELKPGQQDLYTELLRRRPVLPRERPITNPPTFAAPSQSPK